LLARLRAAAGAKDAEVAMLRAELAAEPELRHRLELRLAELERRLGMDSTNSGMPTSKESIGAKERRKAGAGQAGFVRRERRRGLQPERRARIAAVLADRRVCDVGYWLGSAGRQEVAFG
jgi:hypothetical protein